MSLVYRLLNPLGFVAFKMGRRQGGPNRTGVRGRIPLHFLYSWYSCSGGYMKVGRDVTDEQRSRRPIFNATRKAAAGWLFFYVARSARIDPDMGASLAP
ncbi:MAG TPA: hypothetical protein VGY91_09860 [Chthoniobacterales bacterium]|nr:hypothetical protein [Chthoniobacterales bacterium]